jgi:hypothetical protein
VPIFIGRGALSDSRLKRGAGRGGVYFQFQISNSPDLKAVIASAAKQSIPFRGARKEWIASSLRSSQ